MKIIDIEKYGIKVKQNVATDILRQTECMCLNCENLYDCQIAKQLYAFCKQLGLALMITRCPKFQYKEISDIIEYIL